MNKEIKARWVAALRNPEAKQIKGALGDREGNCCLGVLSECAVKAGVIAPPVLNEDGQYFYDGRHDVLPLEVQLWAGLDSENPELTSVNYYGNPVTWTASAWNDDESKTFSEIADMIEDQL